MTRQEYAKYFKLWRMLSADLKWYVSQRSKGSKGIWTEQDSWAVLWRSKLMRTEILQAFLENRSPDWCMAPYLSEEEAEKRNQSYVNDFS